ncbi:MAG: xanthine dehydrogenase family protein [Anaerolineae bacterium]|nr:xanthine dehydrogenase family protein [Anaerolineae bacterium]
MSGQLYMKIRFSDRVHARVRRIDAAPALALPGVVAVFTAADVPVNEYGLVKKDQPVLCGPGSSKPGTDVVRCLMDMVAVVIAETEAQAAQAARLIGIDYEDLSAVFDPLEAMEPDAPQLHDDVAGNALCHYRTRFGSMDAGWAAAEVVVEGEYHTGYQEHAYLQPEAGLGYVDDQGRTTVVVAGQWAHEDQDLIAHALHLPHEEIRVIYPAIGGAFGGREDMSIQIVLALAVNRLRRPIKTIWSREESILYHHKRHPITMKTRLGATRDGKLVALEAAIVADAGPYNYTSTKVLANAHLMITGPYVIPNCHIDTYGVLTNNIPTGAFRGFGAPQALFAAEGAMNKLADALGMDPIELRLRNSIRDGSVLSVGSTLPPGVSMPQVIESCARESYWSDDDGAWGRLPLEQPANPALRRGVGFACGLKNVGYSFGFPEKSWATIELRGGVEIEEVVVRLAGAEVGQGAHTAFLQMTADAVGVTADKVRMILSDTAETGSSGSASASRLSFMTGNAIRGAAAEALEKWRTEDRPAVSNYCYRPPATSAYDPEDGHCDPNFTYGYVAQAAEVEVDIETGLIHVVRVVCADDVGKAINPQLIRGQIEGGVVQALGYAVMENLISRDGKILNPYLSSYLIPTVYDIPREVKSVILEFPDPIGPFGVRGMAEMPFLPLAPAIAAAVHDAAGVWIDRIPMIPDRVVKHLREAGVGVL